MDEPLAPVAAKRQILEILESGVTVFSDHARTEMEKDHMSDQDVVNILRAGIHEPAEWEKRRWRYRARTTRMTAIVQFESENELLVVTAWRNK